MATRATVSAGPSPVPGLRYVSDTMAGIRRIRKGRGFGYVGPDGARVDDPEVLARIRGLAIPPAWTGVWISPVGNGHLQATGRDARGRKQYRYHDRWRSVRDETKYDRLAEFGSGLTPLRRAVERHLTSEGLNRERVLATVVRLMDTAFARVGNLEYARQNKSFGLTTLRDRHVRISGTQVQFRFIGKGGKEHAFDVEDPTLAKVVRRCRDLPGYDLFQYVDETGTRRTIGSGDVNDYIREVSGGEFTAKDFRTWAGTVVAAKALAAAGPATSQRSAKRNVTRAVGTVAQSLGNTPAIARKSYIHPDVIEAYLEGSLSDRWERPLPKRKAGPVAKLRADELRLLRLLKERQRGRRRAAS